MITVEEAELLFTDHPHNIPLSSVLYISKHSAVPTHPPSAYLLMPGPECDGRPVAVIAGHSSCIAVRLSCRLYYFNFIQLLIYQISDDYSESSCSFSWFSFNVIHTWNCQCEWQLWRVSGMTSTCTETFTHTCHNLQARPLRLQILINSLLGV